ncbi:unnamed protein product [Arabis nemorensis]|uniref:Replication factor A C-terminal domain-containing protein n=1 Tax=Arabis nemorensis TaxID=586526 RepID=A0A565BLW9_9BRAS|nr:unnamed protein product [Arabis nemorensis]
MSSPLSSTLTLSNSEPDHYSLESRRTISRMLTSDEELTCSIYATICALKIEIHWFYIGCTKCFKKVNQYFNPETEESEADKFTCDTCQKIVISTISRYQVHVKTKDETGTTSFLLFDKEVIQLINKLPYELLEQQVQFNRRSELPPEIQTLENRQFVFTIYKPSTTKNFRPTTFKVVKITNGEYVD